MTRFLAKTILGTASYRAFFRTAKFLALVGVAAAMSVAVAATQNGGGQSAPPDNGQGDQQGSDPQSGPPQGNYPQGNDPQSNGPQTNDPQSNDPRSNDRQPNDPQLHYPPGQGPQGNGPQGNGSQGNDSQSDQPKASVARISLIHGDISMQRGDAKEWSAASINTPLLRGDQVATGEKSRAEIQLDYANILRLSSRSQATIAELTRTRIQVQISEGYASYTMLKGGEADVEIDTPNVAVRPLRHGRYRVQVNSGEETDVIVREGEVEVVTPQGSTTVKEGQMITVRGVENPEYKVSSAPGKDDWDRFNKDRDNSIHSADSWHRTNEYYTGTHDLDGHGRWVFVPEYGWVWQPYEQSVNWAPYQSGRWVWEPYYGWTWVSYEPWGWAPYHYGRWFFWGSSWVWWPGPVYHHYRPVWGPAFVTFIGFGGHAGVGIGFGNIGWLPCGPRDYFYPWYGRGGNRVNVVNITNITVINNRQGIAPLAGVGRGRSGSNLDLAMTNPRVRGGISGVSADQFGRGNAQVRRLDLQEGDIRQARVMTAAVPVVPTRESLSTGGAGRTPQQLGIQTRNQDRFFTRQKPEVGPPAFHEQQNQMQNVIQGRTGGAQVPTQPRGIEGSPASQTGQAGQTGQGGLQGSQGRPEFHGQPTSGSRVGDARGKAEGPVNSGSTGAPTPGTAQPIQNSNGKPTTVDRGNTSVDQNSNRGGWSKFGTPSGRSSSPSSDSGRINTAPPASNPHVDNAQVPRGSNGGGVNTPSPSGAPNNVPRNDDHGFQRFPNTSGTSNRGTSVPNTNSGSGKPPLQLDRPIVTPRNEGRRTDSPRAESPRSQPPASSTRPEIRNEPRNVPPPSSSRSDNRSRSSSGNSSSHSSHSSSGSSHGSDHGSSHSGSDKSSSKSSSNSKNR